MTLTLNNCMCIGCRKMMHHGFKDWRCHERAHLSSTGLAMWPQVDPDEWCAQGLWQDDAGKFWTWDQVVVQGEEDKANG